MGFASGACDGGGLVDCDSDSDSDFRGRCGAVEVGGDWADAGAEGATAMVNGWLSSGTSEGTRRKQC